MRMGDHPIFEIFIYKMSGTVSRVMYQAIIFLDCTLPHSSHREFPPYDATYPKARRAAV